MLQYARSEQRIGSKMILQGDELADSDTIAQEIELEKNGGMRPLPKNQLLKIRVSILTADC